MAPGTTVEDLTPAEPPSMETMHGRFLTIEKFKPEHGPDLWHHFFVDESTWRYLPDTPPENENQFTEEMVELASKHPVFAVVGDPNHLNYPSQGKGDAPIGRKEALGFVAYDQHYDTQNRCCESGALFGPALRGTVASTEARYLLLRNVFDPPKGPGYRRCSWKTSSFNEPSQRAAARMGFVHEGIWRNHMIVNGKSRDTVWLAIIEEEWPVIKAAFEMWLDPSNFDEDGRQKRRLEDIRESLK